MSAGAPLERDGWRIEAGEKVIVSDNEAFQKIDRMELAPPVNSIDASMINSKFLFRVPRRLDSAAILFAIVSATISWRNICQAGANSEFVEVSDSEHLSANICIDGHWQLLFTY